MSYRDPNLLKTLDIYDGAADAITEAELSSEDLLQAVVGAIGGTHTICTIRTIHIIHTIHTIHTIHMIHTIHSIHTIHIIHTIHTIHTLPPIHTIRDRRAHVPGSERFLILPAVLTG